MKQTITILLAVVMSLVVATEAVAVPARNVVRQRTLPDGTTLMVRLVGDEHHHAFQTEDGHFLTRGDDGFFYYTEATADGRAARSAVRAHDIGLRPAEELDYVAAIDGEAVRQVVAGERETAVAAKPRRAATAVPGRQLAPRAAAGSEAAEAATQFPLTGEQRGIVILVQYSDLKFGGDSATIHDNFARMLNEEGYSDYGGSGSMRDYFLASSRGIFRPTFDVYGPVTLSRPMSYYGGNNVYGQDSHPEQMVIEACRLLDGKVDFRQYDRDYNDTIDYVYVFYAGLGEADGGSDDTVWPHAWNVTYASTYRFDGKVLDRYACSNEHGVGEEMTGIGTITHEFSHVLGLPDLYATDYTLALTPGAWSILDYGPYNGDGRVPPVYSAYERYALGWISPREFTNPATIALEPLTRKNEAYIVRTDKDNEYFIFENRQQEGWDKYLPGHGMLVWHVDYNPTVWDQNKVNNEGSHQYVDIVEADGIRTTNTRAGDAFPGTFRVTSFTDDTRPSMLSWAGKPQGKPITNIVEVDSVVYFDVLGGGDGVFQQKRPQVREADGVTANGFTAHWDAVEGATAYEVEYYQMTGRSMGIAYFDGDKATLGTYYTSNSKTTSNNGSYAGESAPSFGLTATGDYLESITFNRDIQYISFRLTASTVRAAMNQVAVQVLIDGEWSMLETVRPSATGATQWYSVGSTHDIPAGARGLRLEYVALKSGAVYVDDVMVLVGYYPAGSDTTCMATVAAPATSLVLDTLTTGVEYGYRVRAVAGDIHSQWSSEENATPSDGSAIETLRRSEWVAPAEEVAYDALGRRLSAADRRRAAGLIIRRGQKEMLRP